MCGSNRETLGKKGRARAFPGLQNSHDKHHGKNCKYAICTLCLNPCFHFKINTGVVFITCHWISENEDSVACNILGSQCFCLKLSGCCCVPFWNKAGEKIRSRVVFVPFFSFSVSNCLLVLLFSLWTFMGGWWGKEGSWIMRACIFHSYSSKQCFRIYLNASISFLSLLIREALLIWILWTFSFICQKICT